MTKTKPVLSRRQIRGKVLQALYAWYMSGSQPEAVFQHLLQPDFQHLRKLADPADRDSDAFFLRELFFAAVGNRPEYEKLLEPHLENWDWERIALVDRVILLLAVVEFIHFESIPTRVTLNEALELAKTFSTEKSNVFVNGILDAVLVALQKDARIKKSGKGLLDFSKPRPDAPAESDNLD